MGSLFKALRRYWGTQSFSFCFIYLSVPEIDHYLIGQIIEIMGDRVGEPLKVVVQRANDQLVTLTVIPEEANPDM